jgi:hypothetical protein
MACPGDGLAAAVGRAGDGGGAAVPVGAAGCWGAAGLAVRHHPRLRCGLLSAAREVRKALGAADSLALELDLADPAVMQRLGEAALLPAGTRLDARLPPALRPRLVLASTRMGLPPEAVQRLQPWMVSTLLTVRLAETVGFRTEQGVDLWLAGAARATGKPLWALETVDRQIEACPLVAMRPSWPASPRSSS